MREGGLPHERYLGHGRRDDAPHLDDTPNCHTCFGRVIEGMEVLSKLQRRDPQGTTTGTPDVIVKAEVVRKRDHAYAPRKVE